MAKLVREAGTGSETKMRTAIITTLVLLSATAPVAAKRHSSRPFQLREQVLLNGAVVPAGRYDLNWEADGSTAHVTLWQEGKFIAGANGAFVKGGMKFTEDEALLLVNPDGTKSLIEFRIGGAEKAIVLSRANATVHYTVAKRAASSMP